MYYSLLTQIHCSIHIKATRPETSASYQKIHWLSTINKTESSLPLYTVPVTAGTGSIQSHVHKSPISQKPNIILIIADDLGFNDLNGGAQVDTPNIRSLYENGISFEKAYSGHATCAPSRAAIITGRVPSRL